MFLILFALFACAGLSERLYAQQTYKVGEAGPAGGIVFYDKGFASDGWQYLEAAPAGTEFAAAWGPQANVAGTGAAVGSGRRNTRLIVAALGESESAAGRCASLSVNGYADWFLPSIEELDLMFKNLKQKGLGGFKDGFYWSSSQEDSNYFLALSRLFTNGNQYVGYKDFEQNVRAVRAF